MSTHAKRGNVVIPLGSCLSVTCTVADVDHAKAQLIKLDCSNESCPWSGFMHRECYEAFEEEVLKFMRVTGRARSWSEKVRRSNLWSPKGYGIVKKVCKCRCGKGSLRRDTTWEIEDPVPAGAGAVDDSEGVAAARAHEAVNSGAEALWSNGDKRFKTEDEDVGSGPAWGSGHDEYRGDARAWSGEDVWFGRRLPTGGAAAAVDVNARPRGPGIIGMPLTATPSASATGDVGSAWAAGSPPGVGGAAKTVMAGPWDAVPSIRPGTSSAVLGSAALLDPSDVSGWPGSTSAMPSSHSWADPVVNSRPGWPPPPSQPHAAAVDGRSAGWSSSSHHPAGPADSPWPSAVVGGLTRGQVEPQLPISTVGMGRLDSLIGGGVSGGGGSAPFTSIPTTNNLDSSDTWPLSRLCADDVNTPAQREYGYG